MFLDPVIPTLCLVVTIVLVLAIVLRRLRQPHVVAYILAGGLIGPQALGIVEQPETMSRLGSIGVIMLLFFVGMEVNLPGLLARWRIAVGGTLLQILVSIGAVWLIGNGLLWPLNRIILLGFVISLSSTAVVVKLLKESGEDQTPLGRGVTGITLVQDLALVPMLVVLGFLGAEAPSASAIAVQLSGAACVVAFVVLALRRGELPLPVERLAGGDEELRLLWALLLCFGLALLTGLLGLSTALGAFLAGIVISSTRQTAWIHESLASFRALLVGAFFVSIGMLIDVRFIVEQWPTMTALVVAVLLTNTLINALVLRLLGESWADSLYAGALLAQIGELSFLLAAVGYRAGIIQDFAYHATVGTIALSLTLSPGWIVVFRRLTGHGRPPRGQPT